MERQVQGGSQNDWVYPFFAETSVPEFNRLGHRFSSLSGWNGFKANAAAAIRIQLNDVHILLLVNARIPDVTAGKLVELFNSRFGNRKIRGSCVNEHQSIAVAAHFGPHVVQDVLVDAMASGYVPAATAAAEILGDIGSAAFLADAGAKASPLALAAQSADRRLRFAAIRSILKFKPKGK